MAVTRIKNNQITDATVVANAKLVDYSISSAKLANNLVYNSDFTVAGNLTVQGNSTAIDTTITTIEDPIIVLASTQTSGAPAVDIGYLGFRGNQSNIAFVWDESAGQFVTAFTSTGESNTTITITSYANLQIGNLSLTGNILNSTLNVTGNVTAGNLLTPGLVSATGTITSAANVVGGNITTAGLITATGNIQGGNLTTAGLITATGNITGGNLLTSGSGGAISGSGNITGGNILTGGLISAGGNIIADPASFFIGNGSQLTGVAASSANFPVSNGTSNINAAVNANITVGVSGTSNVAVFASTGVFVTGVNSVSGNVTGGNILTAGLISATANVTGGNILTAGLISATSTITSASNITGANITTAGLITATGNVTSGNVNTAGLITATGNITGGNILTGGLVSATGTITSATTITGGNLATAGTITATGNITGGNILTPGLISAAGLATSGNVETAGYVSATGNVFGGNVVTSVLSSSAGLTIQTTASNGNITIQPNGTGNIILGGNTYINGVSLLPAQNNDVASKYYVDTLVSTSISYHEAVVAATNTTLATATGGTITYNQPNGASNGIGATLTTTGSFNLIDTANVQTANTRILVKNEANAAHNGVYVWSNSTVITRSNDTNTAGLGNVDALGLNDYFFTTSGNVNKGTAFIVDAPSGLIVFGTSNIQFAVFSQTQVYSANTSAGLVLDGTVFSAKVDNNTTAFDGGGNISVKAGANLTTPNIGAATGTSLSATGNIEGGNILTGGFVTATGNLAGGNVTTAGLITATGNVTGGNILTAGIMSSTGNGIHGNILTGGVVTATGNITGGNILTAGLVSATGIITSASNISGANVTTAGLITATGNITGGNLLTGGLISSTGAVTSGGFTTTGNVTGGNILFGSGIVSGTGNVYAANFFGNIAGNIDAAGANTQVQFNDTGDILGASAGFTFNKVGNVLTANGNINGANLFTDGSVSATANITGGNILTAGLISATSTITSAANVIGGNISTAGLITATGNVTGGNVNTAGLITATGNITGANFILTTGTIDGPAAGRITINGSDIDTDFAVDGDTLANVFYVDAGTGTASFGASTQVTNAIVNFATTTSIKTPVGNTAQRPGTGVTGMLRFNTTSNALEVYDNSAWTSVGVPVFTVIGDQQFNGDGSTVAFTLSSTQTTNSCIVSINGVVQIPTLAYSVSTTTLTFTEAPASGDVIDVRQITTTTSVTSISNSPGNAVVAVSPTTAQVNVTGDLSVSGTILGGNINSTAITSGTSNVTVVSSGGNVTTSVGGTSNVMVVSSTDVTVNGNLTVTGNATLSGNILGDRIQNGTTIIDIQSAGGNANIQVGGVANIAQFTSTSVVVGANILPTANITYDIGSTSQRFKDLWLSNSTIYLGNSQISANATSLIFTNPAGGQTVLAGVTAGITAATVSASGNVTGGNVLTGGLISATSTITSADNITGGNVLTGGLISATGNVSGGNLNVTGNIVDTGALSIITGSNGNITLSPNGTGVIIASKDILNGQANGVGNIGNATGYFNTIFAKATSAQYADLAEKYTADTDYAPGTVVMFGGSAEVTLCVNDACSRVAGVVSTNPSYRMNDGLQSEHTAMVALTGRVPTSVTGTVRKGDMMVSAGNGVARAEANPAVGTVIGKALADSEGDAVIEVVVGRV
jgi:hypothetical protein